MLLPLAPPPPVSSPGFALPTRRLLARLPMQPGLWVLQAHVGEGLTPSRLRGEKGLKAVHGKEKAGNEPSPQPSGAGFFAATKPSPYPSGGHPQSARLAHYFLLSALLRGERALFLDAANCFNPHRLAEMARRLGREPEELLARVRLSRAFTCFQLAELVDRVPAAARRYGARCLFLTGVPDIFDDEELPADEARRVFARALEGMRRWRAGQRTLPLSTLVFTAVSTPARALHRRLSGQLERAADDVFRFQETPAGLSVQAEKNLRLSVPPLRPPPALSKAEGRLCGGNPRGGAESAEKTERRPGEEPWAAPSPLSTS